MAHGGRILIVDDDPGIRAMLVEYLSGREYDVRAADSGTAMRDELERELPDLVLLDIRLPGEDGLVLARYLRERYDLGIIMVTASGDVIDRVVGLELGADDYVAKPFDPRELLARVKSVMRRMQARPQGDETPPGTAAGSHGRVRPSAAASSTSRPGGCSNATAARSR
jgi:DNA-binding response OmpR family regulator